jgi:GrpB-like predicted nucleotidyltransferase (UPF0157 family)
MRVTVAPYDPQWQTDFERVSRDLSIALSGVDVLAVEHVGSTSVRDLPAKPIIDIDIVVRPDGLPRALAALESTDYVYQGELGINDRHAFKAPDDQPRRNVYVCLDGCLALRNHLAVRETLRSNTDLRDEYASVKRALAEEDLGSIDDYVAGKTTVVQKILLAAGMSAEDRDSVAAANPVGRDRETRGPAYGRLMSHDR